MPISTARVVLFVVVLLLTIVALVGISVTTGAADVTADDAYSSILRKFFPDRFESEYIFIWDDVPGSDSDRLLNYLMNEYGIGWAEGAEIHKSGDGRTIEISNGENSARITLDEINSGKAWLKIEGGKSDNLEVREKNGEMRIHESTWLVDVCVWNLRLPRTLLGILAGIALGTAGAIMQWALKNPLASPYTLGISSVAACGASVVIIFGGASIGGGTFVILGAAGISALIATAIILYISSRRWATPIRVVLVGIAMIVLSGALTLQFRQFGESENVKEAVFWMVGDLNRASWDVLAYMADTLVFCVILLILLIYLASLFGVADKRIRTYAMIVASLMVATTVCFTGTIAFIGLLAPHICRLVVGDDYRFLILVSGLVGAVLLLVSDLVARMIMAPFILPVGKVTAVIGVPFLVYLIVREWLRDVEVT